MKTSYIAVIQTTKDIIKAWKQFRLEWHSNPSALLTELTSTLGADYTCELVIHTQKTHCKKKR